MKTFIALFALFLSLSLTAQTNTATWYLNDTSGSGIQSESNAAGGLASIAMGNYTNASGDVSTAMGYTTDAFGAYSTAMGYGSEASGEYSTAMGRFTTASGDDSTAMGHETSASGYGSFAAGVSNVASGSWGSTALGSSSVASGLASVAIGDQVDATGNHSTAMGFFTTASGHSSTALGYGSTASGKYGATALGSHTIASGHTSTAIGNYTTAEDIYSFVIGVHNNTDETPNPESFSYQNTAFVIGNGGHDSEGNYVGTSDTFSNAFEVLFDGTTNVAGSVTATGFIGDGSQLTNLPAPSVNYGDIANVPFSFNENGTGIQSQSSTASGDFSTSAGKGSNASGERSTAIGNWPLAAGPYSTAIGYYTTANGNSSTAFGDSTVANGDWSTVTGAYTTANGAFSTAMGFYTKASDFNSLVIGRYNLLGSTVTNSATNFNLENTAFVIGNGTASENRSDALVVKFNGDATLAGNLNVNSDARLKANIISLGSTLAKLLQIDGKTYTMKKDENKKQKIGVLAQDIEKVFPELVSESNGIKSVNYQGLVPVLINALKEQEERIKRLEELLLD